MSLLEVSGLTKKFGGLVAINNVSFNVEEGERLSVIGPNGAGKSTLFKLITSFIKPTSGGVKYNGEALEVYPAHKVAQKGVVRTFQETTIFREMTALQNVVTAHHMLSKASVFGLFWNSKRARQDEKKFEESSTKILDYLGLSKVKNELAKNLPHGSLRTLSIGVALAVNPKILLLDEPFAGLNSDETNQAVKTISQLTDLGITVMLIEHDMRAVMNISERIIVLNFGEKIAEGKPDEIKQNQAVIDAYLGKEDTGLGEE